MFPSHDADAPSIADVASRRGHPISTTAFPILISCVVLKVRLTTNKGNKFFSYKGNVEKKLNLSMRHFTEEGHLCTKIRIYIHISFKTMYYNLLTISLLNTNQY